MKRGWVEAVGERRPVYDARVERLRAFLRSRGLQVALIYGDVYRSDDIAHLTNLCIYWNEGVVAVPADGSPVFLAKLSKRVHPWMARTSTIQDLRASQSLPELIGEFLAELGHGAVGLVDRDWWPAPLVDGIADVAPGREFVNLPDAVRTLRFMPDELDRERLERAGALVANAIAAAQHAGGDPAQRLGALELVARRGGARDVNASCREVGGGVQIECRVQFADVWAYGARLVGGDDLAQLQAMLDKMAARLRPGGRRSSFMELARAQARTSLTSHCDIATAGELRSRTARDDFLQSGEVVALAVATESGLLADTYLVNADATTPLTRAPAEMVA